MTRSISLRRSHAAALALGLSLSPLAAQVPGGLPGAPTPGLDSSISPPSPGPAGLLSGPAGLPPGQAVEPASGLPGVRLNAPVLDPVSPPAGLAAAAAPTPPVPPIEPVQLTPAADPARPSALPAPEMMPPQEALPRSVPVLPEPDAVPATPRISKKQMPGHHLPTKVPPAPALAPPSPDPFSAPPVSTSSLLTDIRFDILFNGDTGHSLAEKLGEAVPGINIMLPGDSAHLSVPFMQLKNVNLTELMAAFAAASKADMGRGRPGYSLEPVAGASNILIFQQVQQPGGVTDPNTGSVVRIPYPAPSGPTPGFPGAASGGPMGGGGFGGAPGQPASGSSFFDLSTILQSGDLKVDDITTAIRTAWSSVEGGKVPPEGALKFHQETKLLIVTGSPEYLQSATSIVEILQDRIRPSRDEKDQKLAGLLQQLQTSDEGRARMEREMRYEEEKSREIKDKLQARITQLELDLAKLQNLQVK